MVKAQSKFNVDALSIKDAAYLLALLNTHKTEGFSETNTFNYLSWRDMAPTRKYAHKMIDHLTLRKLIIAKHSEFDDMHFALNESGGVLYKEGANWKVNIDDPLISMDDIIERLEYKLTEAAFSQKEMVQLDILVNELVCEECIGYIHTCAEREGLDFRQGHKTKKIILLGIQKYSISQMYNFIWKSVKESAYRLDNSNVSVRRAGNGVIGNMERFYQKVETENLNVRLYKQDENYYESQLNRIIFTMTLKCKYRWFNTQINKPGKRTPISN